MIALVRGQCAYAALACALTGCFNEGIDPSSATSIPPAIATPGPLAVVRVHSPAALEPLEVGTLFADLLDTHNTRVNSSGITTVWTSSDSSVASIVGSTIVGHLPGDATITATANGISGSAVLHVAWRPDARLVIGNRPISMAAGDHIRFAPTVRSRAVPIGDVVWTSSNALVARMDSTSAFSALTVGSATIVARFAGLADSVRVDVVVAPVGFGYFYSGDAYGDDYDDTLWAPTPGKGYSSAGVVSAILEPPYSTKPDLGWVGPRSPAHDALLHAVSLENLACTAYTQPDTGFAFVTPGAPLVDCRDPLRIPSRWSLHFEFVAFRPAEFTGTLGVVRPGWPPISTNAGGISEISPVPDWREYEMPGVARDSLFWFVSPGGEGVAGCTIASDDVVKSPAVVRVLCTRAIWAPVTPPSFYAVGFGADARHGTAPIGFAQVSRTGAVTRKAVDGLDITTTGSGVGFVDVVVSGARLAAFDRVPAVLFTAISTSPASCSISEPVRATPTAVTFRATCTSALDFVLGVVY
jgi:hypothetical protein